MFFGALPPLGKLPKILLTLYSMHWIQSTVNMACQEGGMMSRLLSIQDVCIGQAAQSVEALHCVLFKLSNQYLHFKPQCTQC